jgi:2,3-bisphosphoglycerate-independent phosphoglycerate mutase
MTRPLVLIVLDGFGIGDGGPTDATACAHTPFLDQARREHPCSRIETSGEAVGLPPGQMGNSEVGHMTMGAGRIIEMDITRISKALRGGGLEKNPALARAFQAAAQPGVTLHLMGLVSDGGVHSHLEHLSALLAHCQRRGVRPAVHAFLDGRDTPPRSGLGYLRSLLPEVEAGGGRFSTVMGRYYAMDRDQRWERISAAYQAMVAGEGRPASDPIAAVEQAYAREEGDEFVKPTVIAGGAPLRDGDAVIFFNFRADRARQLTNALTSALPQDFAGKLERRPVVKPGVFVCFTEYDERFGLPVAFHSETPRDILGEIIAGAGLGQLRIAETEKYAHVTYFFNGGVETCFPGEDRALIPSPRDVATYDHKPEMSAIAVTDEVLRRLARPASGARSEAKPSGGGGAGFAGAVPARLDYSFVLLNFAKPDMVGHTGVMAAAIKAVETVDRGLERICEAVLARGGAVLITADHGNCELMVDPETGQPHTAHTTNPVPLIWVANDHAGRRLRDGGLSDLAPTVLELMGLPIPAAMTGKSLIVPASEARSEA